MLAFKVFFGLLSYIRHTPLSRRRPRRLASALILGILNCDSQIYSQITASKLLNQLLLGVLNRCFQASQINWFQAFQITSSKRPKSTAFRRLPCGPQLSKCTAYSQKSALTSTLKSTLKLLLKSLLPSVISRLLLGVVNHCFQAP